MAAGKFGVLVMCLVYIIIRNVLVNGPKNGMDKCLLSKYSHPNKFLVTNQLDYGKKTLLETFLYAGWYPARCKSKARVKRQINGGDLIICMCLLLSGDIHQCPGPMPDSGPRNTEEVATGVTVCWPSSRCSDGSKHLSMSAADLGGGEHGVIEGAELGLGNMAVSLDECKRSGNPDPQFRSVQSSCMVLEYTRKVKPTVELFLSTRGLHLLHLNIRSLLPKITEIRLLSNSNKVGLFCFTETWLDDSIKDAEI